MNYVRILFWQYKSKANKEGKAPIYLRITVNGIKVELSTGFFIKLSEWDTAKQQAKGVSNSSQLVNNYITSTKAKLLHIQYSLTIAGSPIISAEIIKQKLLGTSPENKSLLQLFD